MKFTESAILLAAAMGICFSSCSDDDDDDSYTKTDPRLRVMAVDGLSTTFVINDAESKIYNYDSLTYGTDITALNASFYGYDANPTIEYYDEKNDEWVEFANSSDTTQLLDLTNLRIRTTSENGKNRKEYTIALRVHKYDVSAFVWKNLATLPVEGTIAKEKGLALNGNFYFFYTNTDGDSYVLKSTDNGAKWTSSSVKVSDADWTTLAVNGSSFFVMAGSNVYSISASDFAVSSVSIDGLTVKQPLFTLNSKFWAICNDGTDDYICSATAGSTDLTKVSKVPSSFSADKVCSLVTKSGKTTTLGFIYNTDGKTSSLWALDGNGTLMNISASGSGLPVLEYPAMANIDDCLNLFGGKTTDGKYSTVCYSSTDGGLNWTSNWHKELPGEIGGLSEMSSMVNGSDLILVSGRNADGYSKYVWNGTLKSALSSAD